MAIEPAAISAMPAVMTIVVVSTAPVRPAARANGTVRPSDIPITMSRTIADDVKCFSTCGVLGMVELDPQGNGSVTPTRTFYRWHSLRIGHESSENAGSIPAILRLAEGEATWTLGCDKEVVRWKPVV